MTLGEFPSFGFCFRNLPIWVNNNCINVSWTILKEFCFSETLFRIDSDLQAYHQPKGFRYKITKNYFLDHCERQEIPKSRVNEILNLQIGNLFNDYQKNLNRGNFGRSERSKMKTHLRSKMKNIQKYSLNRLRKEQEEKFNSRQYQPR